MKGIYKLRLKLIDLIGGLTIYEVLNEYRKDQYLSCEQLELKRKQKLDQLFDLARRSTTYYSRFPSYNDLPVLTKKIVNQDPSAFLSDVYRGKLIKKSTSGSSGVPFIYYASRQAQSHLWAGLLLSWESAGYQFGERVAFVAGNALIKKTILHHIFYRMMNIDLYPVSIMSDDIIYRYLENIQQRKTTIIYGYAMAVNAMADYIIANSLTPPASLRAIVCTSEMLSDNSRANIEKAFGVKVYDQYGCNEAGIAAFECQYHRLHIISSRSVFETDRDGKLISTDLANEADILMKYDTGDIIEFSTKPCSCGRSFPVIQKIIGRSADIIVDRTNKIIHSTFFTHLFKSNPSIKQFQVIYDEISIILNLMVDHNFSQKDFTDYLAAMKTYLDFETYEIVTNKNFYTGSNLKHAFIVDKRNSAAKNAAYIDIGDSAG